MNFKPTTDGQIRYLHVLKKTQPERYAIVMAGRTPEDFRGEDGRDTGRAIDQIKGNAPLDGAPEPVQSEPVTEPPIANPITSDPIFRDGCTRRLIEDSLRANGIEESQTIAQYKDHVGEPFYAQGKLVFRRNPTKVEKENGITHRQPLPKNEAEARATGQTHRPTQLDRFEYAVNEVAAIMRGEKQATGKDVVKPTPEPTIRPEPKQDGLPQECEAFLQMIWRARDAVRRTNDQGAAGQAIPDVGTRAIVNGAQGWKQGVPFEATLHALSIDWTPEITRSLGINGFDPVGMPMPSETKMPEAPSVSRVDVGYHKAMPYVVRLAHARVPIALIGPAGCGKTELAGQLATILGLEFSMLPMSGGVTRGDICGTETMSGFKSRPFPHIYQNGGVFLGDEFDSANPKVLPILNSALANGRWKNPMTGDEPIERHDDFVFVAAMNTIGRGADRQFTARERLDQATLDRFAVGRVKMDYDRDLERKIFAAIVSA